MYFNWTANPEYVPQAYQEQAKPQYTTYNTNYQPTYNEEQEYQDYTFLPKPTFYETFAQSPLDLTRKTTDVTDYEDTLPPNYKIVPPAFVPNGTATAAQAFSPYSNLATVSSSRNSSNSPHNHNTYITGAAINESQNILVDPISSIQPIPEAIKFDELEAIELSQIVEESSPVQGNPIFAQHKSLRESKIWDEEKDEQLSKLGTQYKCDWKKIAKRFNHKKITPHFLKLRYKELTAAPSQRRMKFDHKDDLMIAKYFEKYGSNWTQMATHFKNRSPIMLKNRYYSYIRKRDLIDSLIIEVKELEAEGQLVDDLRDQASEGSVHNENIYDSESNTDDNLSKSCENSSKPASRKKSSLNSGSQLDQLLSSGESSMKIKRVDSSSSGSKMSMLMEKSLKQEKQIGILEARCKSFKGLYLKTITELKLLKNQLQN